MRSAPTSFITCPLAENIGPASVAVAAMSIALASSIAVAANAPTAFAEMQNRSTCDGQWHAVQAVDPVHEYGDYNVLAAVAAIDPTDVWAVGTYEQFSGTGYYQTLAERWDGGKWKVVQTPTPALPLAVLNGVAGSGADDIWAVGYEQEVGGPYRALIEHWNGKRWTIVEDGTIQGFLTSVVAIGPSDVWAAGSTDYIGNGLVDHWDGKSWTPTLLASPVFFRGIAATGSGDVWAVGQRAHNGEGDSTYAVHFDGAQWRHVRTPSPLKKHDIDQNWLTSVSAIASDDVWAVGVTRDPDYGIADRTLAEHWDGGAWHLVHTDRFHPRGNDFWSVAAAGSNPWAVGSVGTDPDFSPLIEEWSDSSWTRWNAPSTGALLGVSVVSPAPIDVWGVGHRVKHNLYTGTLTEHLCTVAR